MTQVHAYLAMSLDGFVAGPQDQLDWLEPRASGMPPEAAGEWAATEPTALGFEEFMSGVGAILMGRRTYDVVLGLGEWPYAEVPMLVATHRPLGSTRPQVSGEEGDLPDLIVRARERAGTGNVYIDGAAMVSGALNAGLLDALVVTVLPTVLGEGISLFGGVAEQTMLTVTKVAKYGEGAIQLHLLPAGRIPTD